MKQTETISVILSKDHVEMLRESVAAGDYVSTHDAVNDALRLWQQARQEHAGHLDTIRDRINRSLDDPRPSLSMSEVEARLNALHRDAVRSLDQ